MGNIVKIIKSFFLSIGILVLTACARPYTISEYVEDPAIDNVRVEFLAVDKFELGDYISFELLTQDSCDKKPDFAKVAELKSWTIFNSDINSITRELPAGKVLNVSVENNASAGSRHYYCRDIKAYILEQNKQYVFKIRNRSTPNSALGGFGCDFGLYVKDASKESLEPVKAVKPDVTICK